MPESLEEIATCALYEPTAQREAVLAREIIAHGKRLDALEAAGGRGEGEQLERMLQGMVERAEDQRDALQQQLAESRAALAKIADPLRLSDYEGVRKIAAVALAATTPTASGS